MAELHENGIGPLTNSTPEQRWDAALTLAELADRAGAVGDLGRVLAMVGVP